MSVSPPASQRSGPPEAGSPFGLSAPTCPRCATLLEEAPEACPHCGFSLPSCAKNFAFDPPPLNLLMDPDGRVPAEMVPAVQARYASVRADVPQVDFAFCLVSLAPGYDVREFSFWLFNQAPDADDSRAWKILVTADFTAGRIVLTPGYAIEPYVERDSWNDALVLLARHGGANDWAGGIAAFLDSAGDLLRSAAARACAALEAPPAAEAAATEDAPVEDSQEVAADANPEPQPDTQPADS